MARILFIPAVDDIATSERTPSLYRMLMESHEVIGAKAPLDRILYDPSRAKWPRYLLYPLDKLLLASEGLRLARKPRVNLVFCETAHHALSGLLVAKLMRIRCVWDSHTNVEFLAKSLGKGRLFSFLSSSLEKFLGKQVDALITATERDALGYVQMGVPSSKVHVVHTFVRLPDKQQSFRTELKPAISDETRPIGPILLFFGSFKYDPNREALEYINRVLAPSLERNQSHCEIRIAGRDIPDLAFHPTIRSLGFVPEIFDCIRSADLCVIPVWRGSGVLTKVLDCMAAGTPTVLSPFAASGIPEVRDEVHAFVAQNRETFPARVREALRDTSRWREISAAARELVEIHYSWETQKDRIENILRATQSAHA